MVKFTYIAGEEEKALWYYRQRLKQEIDPQQREELQKIINELKSKLHQKASSSKKDKDEITLTTISLSGSPL